MKSKIDIFSIFSTILLSLILTGAANAVPINITVTITKINTINDGGDAGEDELFSKVNIDGQGLETSGIVGGETIFPNWTYSRAVNPVGRTSYAIPINIQLWEEDNPGFPFFDDHDRLDINIINGRRDLNISYNLENPKLTTTDGCGWLLDRFLSNPVLGNSCSGTVPPNPGDGTATLFYKIKSDPFRYLANFESTVTDLSANGSKLYEYEYTLTNLIGSTFDISSFFFPAFDAIFDVNLIPGEEFSISFKSGRKPRKAFSTLTYNDLNNTQVRKEISVPVHEPATLLLLVIGVLGGVLNRRRKASHQITIH